MLVYFFVGLIILMTCKIFEQRHKIKKAYINFKDYVLGNSLSWETISNEIIQNKDTQLLESIIGTRIEIYLIEKKESELKVYALNNEKTKSMTEFQYFGIFKKLEKQDMFYTFNIDIGSIYYRFNPPHESHILWIQLH